MLFIIMMSVMIMLNAKMLSIVPIGVIVRNVMAPFFIVILFSSFQQFLQKKT
jgi:hypothetical protein